MPSRGAVRIVDGRLRALKCPSRPFGPANTPNLPTCPAEAPMLDGLRPRIDEVERVIQSSFIRHQFCRRDHTYVRVVVLANAPPTMRICELGFYLMNNTRVAPQTCT